jgi:hypothetical protein
MPLTRPDVISDSVSLSDKLTRLVRTLIAEEGAVDAMLSAGVDELAPNKGSSGIGRTEHDFLPRSCKELPHSSISVVVG